MAIKFSPGCPCCEEVEPGQPCPYCSDQTPESYLATLWPGDVQERQFLLTQKQVTENPARCLWRYDGIWADFVDAPFGGDNNRTVLDYSVTLGSLANRLKFKLEIVQVCEVANWCTAKTSCQENPGTSDPENDVFAFPLGYWETEFEVVAAGEVMLCDPLANPIEFSDGVGQNREDSPLDCSHSPIPPNYKCCDGQQGWVTPVVFTGLWGRIENAA